MEEAGGEEEEAEEAEAEEEAEEAHRGSAEADAPSRGVRRGSSMSVLSYSVASRNTPAAYR